MATLNNVTFANCTGENGHGVVFEHVAVRLVDCTFEHNVASAIVTKESNMIFEGTGTIQRWLVVESSCLILLSCTCTHTLTSCLRTIALNMWVEPFILTTKHVLILASFNASSNIQQKVLLSLHHGVHSC